MAMRTSTRNELAKLRELVRHLADGRVCHFCQEALLTPAQLAGTPGSGRGRPLIAHLSEHHIDGNHDNNTIENRALSHATCHRRFHLAELRRLHKLHPARAVASIEEQQQP